MSQKNRSKFYFCITENSVPLQNSFYWSIEAHNISTSFKLRLFRSRGKLHDCAFSSNILLDLPEKYQEEMRNNIHIDISLTIFFTRIPALSLYTCRTTGALVITGTRVRWVTTGDCGVTDETASTDAGETAYAVFTSVKLGNGNTLKYRLTAGPVGPKRPKLFSQGGLPIRKFQPICTYVYLDCKFNKIKSPIAYKNEW